MHCVLRALAFAAAMAGNNRPASIAMIAITTSSSIRVKARIPAFAIAAGLRPESGVLRLSFFPALRLMRTRSVLRYCPVKACGASGRQGVGESEWNGVRHDWRPGIQVDGTHDNERLAVGP